MMFVITVTVALVALGGLTLLSWRRQLGAPLPAGAYGLVLAVLVTGALSWALLGLHPETRQWLADQRQYGPVAEGIATGQPDLDAASEIPAFALTRVLQSQLVRTPSAEGWYALALLFEQLQAPGLSADAARRSVALAEGEATPALLLVRTLMNSEDPAALAEARSHLDDVLARDPQHEGARMLLGMVARRSGDFDAAIAAWESLLATHPDGEAGDALRKALSETRAAAASGRLYGRIRVTVTSEDVAPGGTVFVFVRRAGETAGQPLAARRVLADRFPLTVTLGPADWLQPMPASEQALTAGARYGQGPGAGVDNSAVRTAPEALQRQQDGVLAAALVLSAGS